MFEIVFDGLQGIEQTFDRLTDGILDLESPTQAALEVLSATVLARIAAVIGPDIRPESRARRRFDGESPALEDSGDMIRAATAAIDGQAHSAYGIVADGGQIGVDAEFHGARRHQLGFGTDRLGRHFHEPARAFMVMGTGEATAVVEVYDRYLAALMASRSR